jgi:hypothetical protein
VRILPRNRKGKNRARREHDKRHTKTRRTPVTGNVRDRGAPARACLGKRAGHRQACQWQPQIRLVHVALTDSTWAQCTPIFVQTAPGRGLFTLYPAAVVHSYLVSERYQSRFSAYPLECNELHSSGFHFLFSPFSSIPLRTRP